MMLRRRKGSRAAAGFKFSALLLLVLVSFKVSLVRSGHTSPAGGLRRRRADEDGKNASQAEEEDPSSPVVIIEEEPRGGTIMEEPPKNNNHNNKDIVTELSERMKPRNLVVTTKNQGGRIAEPKQFLHLHHMKTGGTSMNHMMGCSLGRLRQEESTQIDYYSLSECSTGSYRFCLDNEDAPCRQAVNKSAVMQYCAPLETVDYLDWKEADAITVIRHPVDRIWSLYRMLTRSCFQCLDLKDAYKALDEGNYEEIYCGNRTCRGACTPDQLVNHMTRNLLSTVHMKDQPDEEKLRDARYNIRNRFVVVGLTEDLETTVKMVRHSFPWMAETLQSQPLGQAPKSNTTANSSTLPLHNTDVRNPHGNVHRKKPSQDERTCEFPHANAAPMNNGCGPSFTHMDVPDHPDEELRQIILAHNPLDVLIYEAAVEQFELQKRALGWNEDLE